VFFCPAFERFRPPAVEPMAERTCYGVYSSSYSTNLPFKPFGYPPNQDAPLEKPHKITEVYSAARASETWALVDLDQLGSPNVGWKAEIPPTPVHGANRTYLYFDSHVATKKAGRQGTY